MQYTSNIISRTSLLPLQEIQTPDDDMIHVPLLKDAGRIDPSSQREVPSGEEEEDEDGTCI